MRLDQLLLTIYNQSLLKDNSISQEEHDLIQEKINNYGGLDGIFCTQTETPKPPS